MSYDYGRLTALSDVPELPCDIDAIDEQLAPLTTSDLARTVGDRWAHITTDLEAPDVFTAVIAIDRAVELVDDWSAEMAKISDGVANYTARLRQLRDSIAAVRESISSARWSMINTIEREIDEGATFDSIDDLLTYEQRALNEHHASECDRITRALTEAHEILDADLTFVAGPTIVLPRGQVSSGETIDSARVLTGFDQAIAETSTSILENAAGHPPTAENVREYFAQNPDLLLILRASHTDPTVVARWWEQLGGADSALGAALIAGVPIVIGNMDGIPAKFRTRANISTARERLAAAQAEADKYPIPDRTGLRDAPLSLRNEIAYLKSVIDGERQLYTFDPENDRIVEVIGDPDTATTMITYLPGTGANMDLFYSGDAAQVSRYLVESDAEAGLASVAFIAKDGTGPQWGIGRANNISEPFADEVGQRTVDLQDGLFASDPHLADAYQVGAGHSAGESELVASEVAGSHYDYHASLAGAWLPDQWTPNPDTTYAHYRYGLDALDYLQPFADMPAESSAFSQSRLDPDTYVGGLFQWEGGNHVRAAMGPEQNSPLLEKLRRDIDQDRQEQAR